MPEQELSGSGRAAKLEALNMAGLKEWLAGRLTRRKGEVTGGPIRRIEHELVVTLGRLNTAASSLLRRRTSLAGVWRGGDRSGWRRHRKTRLSWPIWPGARGGRRSR
jgi:hypothetical protein